MHKYARTLSAALVAMLAIAACAPAAAPTPTAAPKPAATTAPVAPAAPASSPAAASPVAAPAASPAAAAASPVADFLASSRPPATMPAPGSMPAGSTMKTIFDRGKLIAGVRQDVPLIGFLNPRTSQIEGFDIEFVKEITKAIFGDETKLELRPVNAAARIPSLTEGQVDLVAAAMTITADRKNQIDFSAVYYEAGQRVLVRKDATYTTIADMSGKKICAAKGTTAEANIPKANAAVEVVQADAYPECLLQLQQGRIDGISTDDVILAGLASQDPNTKLIGPQFTSEPYGLGIQKGKADFTAFVNGVLQQTKTNGKWKEIYGKWFGQFAATPEPPTARYSN